MLGATRYGTKADVWSGTVVLTEMLQGISVFYSASSSKEQIMRIMEYLGPPSLDDCREMGIKTRIWPPIHTHKSLRKDFPKHLAGPYTCNFLLNTLTYRPGRRLSAWETLVHPFFEELHRKVAILPSGRPPPPLFDFSEYEMSSMPRTVRDLLKQVRV